MQHLFIRTLAIEQRRDVLFREGIPSITKWTPGVSKWERRARTSQPTIDVVEQLY